MASRNYLTRAFEETAVPEIRSRLTGPNGTFFYTNVQLRVLAYALAIPLFTREGRDVKVEEYPSHRIFRASDTVGRYVFILDQPARDETGEVREQIKARYLQDARRMPTPADVWLVALPEVNSQFVRVYDLLEELGVTTDTKGNSETCHGVVNELRVAE